MNQKSFLNGVSNGKKDIIQEIIDLLNDNHIEYCVIGGLAVNAYVEPVVSLDLDAAPVPVADFGPQTNLDFTNLI